MSAVKRSDPLTNGVVPKGTLTSPASARFFRLRPALIRRRSAWYVATSSATSIARGSAATDSSHGRSRTRETWAARFVVE
eukprot:3338788-Prymnesium_polylepis.1